jgi:hypothetical protein
MFGGVCINGARQTQGQTHGGLSVGDWESNVGEGNIHATGRVLALKNLQTKRKRVCFSDAVDDPNHSMYNNGWNIDGEGAWDGIKMNVYSGLDVRTGNANGAVPRTLLSARDNTVTLNGNDYNIPLNVQSNTDSHIQLKTQNDNGKNVYLINRDGHFRVHQNGLGDRFEVNRDGNTVVNGNLNASSLSFGGGDAFKYGRYNIKGFNELESTNMNVNDWHAIITGTDMSLLREQYHIVKMTPKDGVWHVDVRHTRFRGDGCKGWIDVTFLSKRMKNSIAPAPAMDPSYISSDWPESRATIVGRE